MAKFLSEHDDASRSEPPTNIRWSVFAVALATSAVLYLHRYSFSFVKPVLAREWQLSNVELGRFDSAFAICYSLFQFPLAVGADLVGVRLVLTLLVLIWGSGLALLASAPSPRWVAAAQALSGTGQSAVYACLARLSRSWYPPRFRSIWQGLVSVFAGRLGAIGAPLIFSTLLLGTYGLPWRTAVGVLAASAAVLALAVVVVVRDSPADDPRVNRAERQLIHGEDPVAMALEAMGGAQAASATASDWSWKSASRGRVVLLVMLSLQAILSTFADNIYSNWLPQFLAQVHQLEFKRMGIFAALPLLGGALAGFLGGALNDYWLQRTGNRRWARAGVAVVGKSLAALVLLAALTQYEHPYVFCGFLFVVKALGDWSLVSLLGVVTDVGGRATASVFALVNTLAGLGQITAPLVFGFVADHYGWRPVFVLVAIAYALCAGTWLAIDGQKGAAGS